MLCVLTEAQAWSRGPQGGTSPYPLQVSQSHDRQRTPHLTSHTPTHSPAQPRRPTAIAACRSLSHRVLTPWPSPHPPPAPQVRFRCLLEAPPVSEADPEVRSVLASMAQPAKGMGGGRAGALTDDQVRPLLLGCVGGRACVWSSE
jgi:hypothetical protein